METVARFALDAKGGRKPCPAKRTVFAPMKIARTGEAEWEMDDFLWMKRQIAS